MAVFGSFFSGFGRSKMRKWGQLKEINMKFGCFSKLLVWAASLTAFWMAREPLMATWKWFGDQHAVTTSMSHLGLWGIFVMVVLLILQVFLAFIPGQALMVACGYIYGFWGGFFVSWLSLVIGGETAFLLARCHGQSFAERWISPQVLARWTAKGQGITFYALSLVMPFVPNDAMCYVAGLDRITHRRFSMANLLGRGLACLIGSAHSAYAPPSMSGSSSLPLACWSSSLGSLLDTCRTAITPYGKKLHCDTDKKKYDLISKLGISSKLEIKKGVAYA
jgi:uncharacterized membrane protein YdjX (TVP38/TMEM64 family)